MKNKFLWTMSAAAMLAAPLGTARADLVFMGSVFGTGAGLGSVATVLTIQSPGNTTSGSGCVTPTGIGSLATCGFADVGVQNGQTQVQIFRGAGANANLTGLNGNTLRLIYNGGEPGNDESNTITGLSMTLYSGNTALQTFTTRAGTLPLPIATFNGIGQNGYYFGLDASQAAAFNALVAAQSANAVLSIGGGLSVTGAQGNPETLAIAVGPAATVPEPSTYALMATGLVGLVGFARRRRQQV